VEDFIIKFKHKNPVESTPMDAQTSANRAKQFFFGLTGLTGKRRKRRKR